MKCFLAAQPPMVMGDPNLPDCEWLRFPRVQEDRRAKIDTPQNGYTIRLLLRVQVYEFRIRMYLELKTI